MGGYKLPSIQASNILGVRGIGSPQAYNMINDSYGKKRMISHHDKKYSNIQLNGS